MVKMVSKLSSFLDDSAIVHSMKVHQPSELLGNVHHGVCNFRDICGDKLAINLAVQKFSKHRKGRKDKRFQPIRSLAYPCIDCSCAVPQDHIFLSTNKQNLVKPAQKINCDSSRFVVKKKEMNDFFKLTDDSVIQDFLRMDSCKRIADKYLIAMVFAYFKRADFSLQDYTRMNFFLALYLANDVEEDEEEIKYEIFPWVLGKNWRTKYSHFLKMRDQLLKRIDFKAIISRRCCDEIMAIEPSSLLWRRERLSHHGGATRSYMKDPNEDGYPRGPNATPHYCAACDVPDVGQYTQHSKLCFSSRDNIEMKKTLPKSQDDIWPSVEE
ncbi:speedy protein A-like isoform X2 [Biomphalaria glabrata]|uniref:Speedy protein A-like isoform X2 n=1 Tax=Biomphalaria glabrata TaxID=6526 RepID=A0A9W2ZW17_BIOGL|nr:speedy protein A-like isoform X2 [Biomphalaria glabrata]